MTGHTGGGGNRTRKQLAFAGQHAVFRPNRQSTEVIKGQKCTAKDKERQEFPPEFPRLYPPPHGVSRYLRSLTGLASSNRNTRHTRRGRSRNRCAIPTENSCDSPTCPAFRPSLFDGCPRSALPSRRPITYSSTPSALISWRTNWRTRDLALYT